MIGFCDEPVGDEVEGLLVEMDRLYSIFGLTVLMTILVCFALGLDCVSRCRGTTVECYQIVRKKSREV